MNKERVQDILSRLKRKEITPEEANRLLQELKKEKKVTRQELPKEQRQMIAVIGMSGRFPETDNIEEFWDMLCQGKDLVIDLTEKWNTEDVFDATPGVKGKTYSKWGGSIKNVENFDSLFFNISPKEAAELDPQQRIFLEETWKALEDAGCSTEQINRKKCGVFVGAAESDYDMIASGENEELQNVAGKSASFIAARISYFLNLQGPCMTIDTACSSALVAIHQGCQSIRTGESDLVIAGGSCILNTPKMHIATSQGIMLSKDGKCKAFDNQADGFVPSEAVGVVILKPLEKAIMDHDNIYGVIVGSAINQDGKSNGITAPSGAAQRDLELKVYEKYHVNPENITYVEAHGTGTKIGDPIEVSALTESFSKYTDKKQYCAIGSVKSNIGHALSASGVVSLIKTMLCIKHKKMVPSIHYKTCNEHICLEDSPFYVSTKYCDWVGNEKGQHIAAISSFGLSGTNVHMVVADAPKSSRDMSIGMKQYVLPFSAKTKESLEEYLQVFQSFLIQHKNTLHLGDLAFTLQSGREHFKYRYAVVVCDIEDCIQALQERRMIPESADALFDRIAYQYMQGDKIPWNKLGLQKYFYKTSLPTYQFQKIHCWKADSKQVLEPVLDEKMDYLQILKKIMASTLNIEESRIDEQESFEHYGIDSIIINDLNRVLEETFGELPKTLFFTYKNLATMAHYFEENQIQMKQQSRNTESDKLVQAKEQKVIGEQQTQLVESHEHDKIAIIGLSGHYPMSEDVNAFWKQLLRGADCIEEIPIERWDYKKYYNEELGRNGGMYCYWGGFLPDIDKFDASFFQISPLEAKYMDPQERLFLQTVWECMEDAGVIPEKQAVHSKVPNDTRLSIGVFVGATYNNYQLYAAEELQEGKFVPLNSQMFSLANRVSYIYDFKGPSMIVDTACSSSLSAIHMACESIKTGECEMAIAGGVNLSLHPSKYMTICAGQFGSSDGRCRAFGEGGDGYVPAEGVGAVLLKPLKKALTDGDQIYGVIQGTAMNHDGKTYGFTVPNPVAQEELIVNALEKANVHPRTISYIEAHGTGTSLGDPIEIEGLTKAFEHYTKEKQFCAIGSVKSNIGHGEAAGGIASLTKVLLQMKYKKLVPSLLHSDSLNKNIPFEKTPFYVQTELSDWKQPVVDGEQYQRRAGISSFGAGGVNAHAIVEEFVQDRSPKKELSSVVICISAKGEENLRAYVSRLSNFLSETGEISLTNLAYTLQFGRREMKHRVAFVVNSKETLIKKLEAFIQQGNLSQDTQDSSEYVIKLVQMAQDWMSGKVVDWTVLYEGCEPKRISLPTYAFSKEHFWIGEEEQKKETIKEKPEDFYDRIMSSSKSEQLLVLKEYLQKVVADILGYGDKKLPETEEGFFDLGMDSVHSTQFFQVIEKDLHIEVYSTAVFDYPNIDKLSEYILSMLAETSNISDNENSTINTQVEEIVETEISEKNTTELIYYSSDWIREDVVITSRKAKSMLWFEAKDCTFERKIVERGYQDWYSIKEGNTFTKINKYEYSIAPEKESDYCNLITMLTKEGITELDIVYAWSNDGGMDEPSLRRSMDSVFYLLKALRTSTIKYRVLYCYDNCSVRPMFSALSGFFKSLIWENPNYKLKAVGMDFTHQDMGLRIHNEILSDYGKTVEYRENERYISCYREMLVSKSINSIKSFRTNGVYLITGGSGQLGMKTADYLMKTYNAKIALTGRRAEDETIKKFLDEHRASGYEVIYIPANITDQEETNQLVGKVKEQYGVIHGVIHAAGVVIDSYFAKKTMEEVTKVLSPKVFGTLCLDRATKDEPLEVFILFSSLASTMGNGGQSDYAYANGFMDWFAMWRNQSDRSGKAISINWPIWKNGGMKITKEIEEIGFRKTGISFLIDEEGLQTLEYAVSSSKAQVGLVKAKRDVFLPYMPMLEPEIEVEIEEASEDNPEELMRQLEEKLEYWGL